MVEIFRENVIRFHADRPVPGSCSIVARRRSRELIGSVNTAASCRISRSEQHRKTQVRFKSCHLGHFPFLFATSSYYIFLRRNFCVRFIVLRGRK